MIDIIIPRAVEVRAWLRPLSHRQMCDLARASGVPFTTLWKIRSGETDNPRIETVRALAPYVEAVARRKPSARGS